MRKEKKLKRTSRGLALKSRDPLEHGEVANRKHIEGRLSTMMAMKKERESTGMVKEALPILTL